MLMNLMAEAGFNKVVGAIDYVASALSACVSIAKVLYDVGYVLAYPFIKMADAISKVVEAYNQLKQIRESTKGSGAEGGEYGTDVGGLVKLWKKLTQSAKDNGAQSGAALDAGLAAGITGGTMAEAAASSLGRRVYAALQAELDAHSPSRKAAYLGRMIGAGLAGGQEESSREVQTASTRLVQLPEQTAARSGGGGGRSVSVGNVTITISGVPGAAEAKDEIRRVMVEVLEGTAHESGVPVSEAA
jgi:hypothetical protein